MHQRVEDDDTLQRRTERHHPAGTVVLLLFSHEQITDLRIVDHELDLLLRTGGIEWYRDGTDTPCTEVTLQILHRVLGEDTNILLYPHTKVQQCVADLLNGL